MTYATEARNAHAGDLFVGVEGAAARLEEPAKITRITNDGETVKIELEDGNLPIEVVPTQLLIVDTQGDDAS